MESEEAKKRAEELREEIEYHRHRYYVLHQPVLSDGEYDALERELRGLEERFPDLATPDSPTRRVGSELAGGFETVLHSAPMLSLDNCYTSDELLEFEERIRRQLGDGAAPRYVAELKVDGVSISLRYREGFLREGITRGDGERGDDVTANVRTIRSLPLRLLKCTDTLEVRGEVYLPAGTFERINRERLEKGEELFANPRNAAAGTLKQLDPGIASERGLEIFVHEIVTWQAWEPVSHWDALTRAGEVGFRTNPASKLCDSMTEVEAFLLEWSGRREELDYEIDGVVVKVDDMSAREKLGRTAKAPRWAIAFKYPAEQATTVVREIILQVGRTGAVTPVALLDPVRLSGSTVSRATLHNEEDLARKDVRVGDRIVVEKGGEIIPKVVKVVKEKRPAGTARFRMPRKCPVCGSRLFRPEGEVITRCTGADCPAKTKESVLHFTRRTAMNIEGLGTALVDQLLEKGMVEDLADIYALREEEVAGLERMGEKSARNLVAEIERSRSNPLHRLLFGLGIRYVGEKVARLLAGTVRNLDELKSAKEEELEEIDGVGPRVAESVVLFFQQERNRALVERLRKAGVNFESARRAGGGDLPLEGKAFVLTGTLESLTREAAKERILSLGGRVTTSVSGKTDFVVAGSEPGSKYRKALKLNVKTVKEEEFLKMLEEAGER